MYNAQNHITASTHMYIYTCVALGHKNVIYMYTHVHVHVQCRSMHTGILANFCSQLEDWGQQLLELQEQIPKEKETSDSPWWAEQLLQ